MDGNWDCAGKEINENVHAGIFAENVSCQVSIYLDRWFQLAWMVLVFKYGSRPLVHMFYASNSEKQVYRSIFEYGSVIES